MIRHRTLVFVLAAVVFVAAACGGDEAGLDVDVDPQGPADHAFVIPVGAGEALDAGNPLEILPAELPVRVGEIIEIVNEDDRGHLVGPFYVGAGETLRQQFASPGEYIGECTVHPSGQIVVTVT